MLKQNNYFTFLIKFIRKQIICMIIFVFFIMSMGCSNWILGDEKNNSDSSSDGPDYFTIGVFLQSPIRMRDGKNNAQNYKAIGVNTFIGLWEWPSEEGMGEGYNLLAAKALKDNGLKVYAGRDMTAVEWIKKNEKEYDDTFIGYILGDEPDMRKINPAYEDYDDIQPDQWKENGNEIRDADPDRFLYATFGKGFALDPWSGYHPTTTKEEDFKKYVSPLTSIAADFYGLTDPYELPSNHGIWTYGRVIRNLKKYSGKRPVWGVVEGSCPWTSTELTSNDPANRMYDRMQPELLKPVVWNMIVNGATGIVYFCHDFSSGMVEDGVLAEPGMPEAMKKLHAMINKYAEILLTDDVSGTEQMNNGEVAVRLLTKKFDGKIYIFAMGDGNVWYREGQAVTATIKVKEASSEKKTVTVDGENRTIQMINNKFSDHFDPYELHIYVIND